MNALDILYERGFIKQTVFEDDLRRLLDKESVTFYAGFDPTADSLHIGHYIPIMAMAHMQRAGHKPIVLFGGGTGFIGDPSGKSDMRELMSAEIIERNVQGIRAQMSRFLSHEGKNAVIEVNNADWLKKLNYIDFLREIGVYFSVNKMLTADCYKTRMEKGLNFLELNYMLMQSYDFYMLYKNHGCVLQLGGNDQWSNILSGADLIRRKEQADAYAITVSLLLKSDGTKMGKTSKGALWLSADKTPPYDFYQYFRNMEDVKVDECLRLLTFLPMDEIRELTKHKDERINEAKKRLAFEVTKLIHGEAAALAAEEQSRGAFEGGAVMPTVELALAGDTQIVDIMLAAGVANGKGEARRLIEGGGVRINETRIEDIAARISDVTDQREFVLHKGKKVRIKVILR